MRAWRFRLARRTIRDSSIESPATATFLQTASGQSKRAWGRASRSWASVCWASRVNGLGRDELPFLSAFRSPDSLAFPVLWRSPAACQTKTPALSVSRFTSEDHAAELVDHPVVGHD